MDLRIRQHGWFLIAGACIVFALRADSTSLDTVDHHSLRQISSQPVVRTRRQLAHVAPTLAQQQAAEQLPSQQHQPLAEFASKTPVKRVASIDRKGVEAQVLLADEPRSRRNAKSPSSLFRAASFSKSTPAKAETGAWLSGQIEVENAEPKLQPTTPTSHPLIIRARKN